MTNSILTLSGSVVLVFLAAVIFVNAIEWIGCRFRLGCSFIGAIMAPVFTSFPELTVFLVAVLAYKGTAGEQIGIGTLFGQPFMASSLSYGLVGVAALIGFWRKKRNTTVLTVDKSLAVPYIFITILFPLTLVPALFHGTAVKYIFGVFFLSAFVYYIRLMYKRRMAELIDEADELYFCKVISKSVPGQIVGASLQIIAAIALLYFGSKNLVASVDVISHSINISPMGLALIVIPAATAIPETASALIWGYRGKDTLSVGALVGEKVLYSTFYPGLGLLITTWTLDIHAGLSVAATTIISLILLFYVTRQKLPWYGLCFGFIFFIAYAVLIFVMRI